MMFLYGIQVTIIGVVLPLLIADFAISNSAGGLLVTSQSGGGIAALIASLIVSDKVSRRGSTITAFAALGALSIAIGLSKSYWAAAIWFLLVGMSMRLFDIMANTSVGEYGAERRNRSMNILHACFAAGAILGPVIAQLIWNVSGSWRTIFFINGVVVVVAITPIVFITQTNRRLPPRLNIEPDSRQNIGSTEDGGATSKEIRSNRDFFNGSFILLAVALVFYSMHQSTISAWLPHLLVTSGGLKSGNGGIGLSAYWFGIVAGRMATSRIPDRTNRILMISIGAILSGLATAGAIAMASSVASLPLFTMAGATSGAVIPLALSEGHHRFPTHTGTVTAIISLSLLVGRFSGPWIVGRLSDTNGIEKALYLSAFVLLLCAAAAYGAKRSTRRDVTIS